MTLTETRAPTASNTHNTSAADFSAAVQDLCHHPMQVLDIHQETRDVWTLSLQPTTPYAYQPGQYALVRIGHESHTVRAYTLSSSPDVSTNLSITVRRIANGQGSTWLTEKVNVGDTLWLSDAQGEFTCASHPDNAHYLMLGAGCGITPLMSMARWLLAFRPQTHITLLYHASDVEDLIFADHWQQLAARFPQQLTVHLLARQPYWPDELRSRLNQATLEMLVPDIHERIVMTCGPEGYMQSAVQLAKTLGVPAEQIHQEAFFTATASEAVTHTDNKNACSLNEHVAAPNKVRLHIRHALRDIDVPVGTSLLAAMEQHNLPVFAACRAGVCGSCKVQIIEGEVDTTSQSGLTQAEIEQGYVLACSCRIKQNITLA